MPKPTITQFFQQDHNRLDALFEKFRANKRANLPEAAAVYKDFAAGLQRHIIWEEQILFPLWEERSGMSDGGPTSVMRSEHRLIKQFLETIRQKIQQADLETEADEQTLIELLSSHNLKEERILYTSTDRLVSEQEYDELYKALETVPENR
jgi:iron-sulfur cluster repair protein YtfE (RIC family)